MLSPPMTDDALSDDKRQGALESGASKQNLPRTVFMPRNNQTVQIHHKPLRAVRMVGRMAEKNKKEGQMARGVLVTSLPQPTTTGGLSNTPLGATTSMVSLSTSHPQLMHPDDLTLFSKLHRGRLTQRQAVAVGETSFSALRLALEVMFEGVEGAGVMPVEGLRGVKEEEGGGGLTSAMSIKNKDQLEASAPLGMTSEPDPQSVRVGGMITVSYYQKASEGGSGGGGHVVLEWEGGQVADVVADAVVAVLLQVTAQTLDSHRTGLYICIHLSLLTTY